MKKRLLGPCVTFFPQPATLIATRNDTGFVNLMMASWVGVVTKTPPTIAVSLNQGRQTYANIKATGSFSVNVVPGKYAVEADLCGLVSGKQHDKLQLSGLTVEPGTATGVPLVKESPLNVECRLTQEIILGDYHLMLGEIVEIHACEAAYNADGKVDIQVFDPLVYLGGMREYWTLGEKAADAYQAGLKLMPKTNDEG